MFVDSSTDSLVLITVSRTVSDLVNGFDTMGSSEGAAMCEHTQTNDALKILVASISKESLRSAQL
jgi:hypothetical protein